MYVKDLIEDVIDYLDNNINYDIFKKLNTSYVNKSNYAKLIICDICEHWLNYQNTQSVITSN